MFLVLVLLEAAGLFFYHCLPWEGRPCSGCQRHPLSLKQIGKLFMQRSAKKEAEWELDSAPRHFAMLALTVWSVVITGP